MKRIYTLLVCALFTANMCHAQLTNGLIAHWNFNGNANDATGNGHNGTPVNVTAAAGKAGTPNTAYSFNGTDSKITVPYQSDLNTSKFSICGVIKLNGFYTALCQGNRILCRGGDGVAGAYHLQLTDNHHDSSCVVTGDTSKFSFDIERDNATTYHKPWTAAPIMHTGDWHCVVGTFNDTVFKMYVDGTLQATVAPYYLNTVTTGNTGIAIGANYSGSSQYPYWFNGIMDDLRLYNRALSAAEVSLYCNPLVDTGGHDTSLAIRPLVQPVQLAVYPNPTNGNFTVAGTIPEGNATISVYNAVGQLVHSENITAMAGKVEHTITLSGKLTDGMYLVNIRVGKENKTYRISVSKH